MADTGTSCSPAIKYQCSPSRSPRYFSSPSGNEFSLNIACSCRCVNSACVGTFIVSPLLSHLLVGFIIGSQVSNFLKYGSSFGLFIGSPIFLLGSGLTRNFIVLPSTGMISIPTGSRKTHFQEFPRHVHTNEVSLGLKSKEHLVYLSRRVASSRFIYKTPMSTNVVSIRAHQ